MIRILTSTALVLTAFLAISGLQAKDTILLEAESFQTLGGWKLDTQFIETMESPYLLAHGLGKPVADASTELSFEKAGTYKVWVRTKDWVARWDAPGTPGRFQVKVAGNPLQPGTQQGIVEDSTGLSRSEKAFGTMGKEWHWQPAGEIEIAAGEVSVELHDLTGFGGRCDAILFSSDPDFSPPEKNSSQAFPEWRQRLLGHAGKATPEGPFDIVFVGGGYAGSCGAISAARMGLKVALIQNRGVLGGNGSSEVRVWAKGNTPPGLYPIGDIIREFEDHAKASPGTFEEFEDSKKETIARAEKNLSLFLNHHAFAVEMEDATQIRSVRAFDTRSGAVREFTAKNFCDATGHGFIGLLAGADHNMIDGGRMGMSNMWRWEHRDSPQNFPDTPWTLDLGERDFPYPRKFHAEWFWESGYDKHPIDDLEAIRDWNLRAGFGAWNAIKNKGAHARADETGQAHKNAQLVWMAYVGGTRETLQLLGDVVLTEEDIVTKKPFPDGCVLTTWSVDLHYPKEQYAGKYPDNPFISYAVHGKGVDRKRGYPVPYRCFYSRNIKNLFMAGRNVSVTHKALGTVRVMKTCGMMGVVVGKAAAVSSRHDCTPREVYYQHLSELIDLMKMPGYMRRDDLKSDFYDDPNLPHLEQPETLYVSKASLPGIVIDDNEAKYKGNWTQGDGLKGHIEDGYRYIATAPKDSPISEARFEFSVPKDGDYEVRIAFQPHQNRASNTPVTVYSAGAEKTHRVNQEVSPPLAKGFYTLGVYRFEKEKPGAVVITNQDTDGISHADAVQILPQK